MSETAPEQSQAQAQAAAPPPPDPPADDPEQTFPLKLIKSYTGDVHWNVGKGIWELVTHGETGEPTAVYQLVATIDGQDVSLAEYNAGGIESRVASLKSASQSDQG